MGAFLFFIGVIVLFIFAMRGLTTKTAVMVARINDCCDYRKCSNKVGPAVAAALGIVIILVHLGLFIAIRAPLLLFISPMFWLGVALIGLPCLLLFFKHKSQFWKVLMLKLMLCPVMLVNFFSNVLGGNHYKSKKTTNIVGEQVEYTYAIQEYIEQDGWQLQFLYSMGNDYYQNVDGTVCIVDHKQTLQFRDLVYEIRPLYNINDSLPGWIRWLY